MLRAAVLAAILGVASPAGSTVCPALPDYGPAKPQLTQEATASEIPEPNSLILLGAALIIGGFLGRNIKIG